MREQSKAAKRRHSDGAFLSRYFVGDGIDIGGAPDPLAQYIGVFPLLKSVRTWDVTDGDAELMEDVIDNTYDFIHASHCLEHMRDVRRALSNWARIARPGGYLVISVPDEDLYEQGHWPSRFNRDHKWSFTSCKATSWAPRSINIIDLAREFADRLDLERLVLQRDFFRDDVSGASVDQTRNPVAECSIEIVWRKRS